MKCEMQEKIYFRLNFSCFRIKVGIFHWRREFCVLHALALRAALGASLRIMRPIPRMHNARGRVYGAQERSIKAEHTSPKGE